tara:strand:+ start:309 stop:1799 length:1491 start_codon:yes stop_codon:yes gene_type:complete
MNKHLFCILNANDPTPTAYAIRSSSYDKVTVFILGKDRFNERQSRALYRFKKWLSGSAKGSETWPKGLWSNSWDWAKPQSEINLVEVDTLSEEMFDAEKDSAVVIDLKSGTKKMSIEMVEYSQLRFENPQYIMANIGSCIALSHGVVVPTQHLSLNEMVWLSSGFVIDTDYKPDADFAQQAEEFFEYKVKVGGDDHQRVSFERRYLQRIGKEFQNDESDGEIFSKYLEEFTSAILANKEEIVESCGGVRFIYPKRLKNCMGRAEWVIFKQKYRDDFSIEHEVELREFFESKVSNNKAIIDYVRKKLHTMEIDTLALTKDGLMVGVECKYGRYTEIDVDRIYAICSRLSPRFHPLLVNSKTKSNNARNVLELPFPFLTESLSRITLKNPGEYKIPESDVEDVNESSKSSIEKVKDEFVGQEGQAEIELDECTEMIAGLLLLIKEHPITWPEFYLLLQENGVKMNGLFKFLSNEFASSMGFNMQTNPVNRGIDWIRWI